MRRSALRSAFSTSLSLFESLQSSYISSRSLCTSVYLCSEATSALQGFTSNFAGCAAQKVTQPTCWLTDCMVQRALVMEMV